MGHRCGSVPRSLLFRSICARQINFEHRTLAGDALCRYVPPALLNDAVHQRKSQTRAMSGLLGCKKGFENSCFSLIVHTMSGVAHGHEHVVADLDRAVTIQTYPALVNVAGLDNQLATLRHGVARIYRQVHKNLLHLSRINFD